MTPRTFEDILQARYSRRRHIKHILMAGAAAVLPSCDGETAASKNSSTLTFPEVPFGFDDTHHVAQGYRADVLIRWGDEVVRGAPAFEPGKPDASAQSKQFGFNNDFIGYFPLPLGSKNSDHGLLCVNHEYAQGHMMFPGFKHQFEEALNAGEAQLRAEQAAVGLSVIEVKKENGDWRVVPESSYARRINVSTPMNITGPATGHARLVTSADPTGMRVLGTLANCAGGVTPWGTVLTCEENFQDSFWGDRDRAAELAPAERAGWDSFGAGFTEKERATPWDAPVRRYALSGWSRIDDRFDITKEPHESNRFGWVVEIDPYDPESVPKKRTALGRIRHEGATVVAKPGKPVAVYSGDDQEFQFVYKFVSHESYAPDDRAHNMDLLKSGTLYAAKFNDDGTGEWLALDMRGGSMIDARQTAEAAGATHMDQPEDIETSPVNDCTYVTLTKNRNRQASETDAANPRPVNYWGHIIEIRPPAVRGGRNHTATTFEWEILALGGDPRDMSENVPGRPHANTSESGWFANPDNLVFDPKGRMWISTDGMEDSGEESSYGKPIHDGLWAMDVDGEGRALPRHFFGCPRGAELTGPCFTPDGKTLFVSVQHPASEGRSTFDAPSTRWPDFDAGLPPRPSVVVITKDGGGEIGS